MLAIPALMLCVGLVLFIVGVTTKKKGLWIAGVVLGGLAMLIVTVLAVVIGCFAR